tara:strand:- start:152 stop:931 length:780 start_codon:yes stop_codon:yes gene_type:complete
MDAVGEKLNSPLIPYPGKQLLSGSSGYFFALKEGIKDRYIYDLTLSTGEIMYECKGGMGFSDEKHIIGLHDLIQKPYAEPLILEEFKTHFKGKWGPAKYNRLRRDLNQELRNPSRRTFAKLYCLMSASGFIHKFDRHGNFKCEYFPHTLDTSQIGLKNRKLINSDFILIKSKFGSFKSELLTKDSLAHIHLPFPSTGPDKKKFFSFLEGVDSKGKNFLLTARLKNRNKTDEVLLEWSKNYSSIVFHSSAFFSDIFITNF